MSVQPDGSRGSEDCLYLNVWSPGPGETPRPVFVWVHGGGFVAGSGSEYDGAAMAARGDAVVVTVNYRLGPWGFLHLADVVPEFSDCANLALLDLIAALGWVRDNIAAFGGDPGRVTLLGQSAGAMLTGTLLGTPAAAGLFHAAALFSGAAEQIHDREEAAEVTGRLLVALQIRPRQAAKLRELPVATLATAADSVRLGSADAHLGSHAYRPVVDGEMLPRHPLHAVGSGLGRHVPLLISWCRDEMAAFWGDGPDSFVPRGQRAYLQRKLGEQAWAGLQAAYSHAVEPPANPDGALLGDALFGLPAIRLADEQHRGGGRAWLMRYDHVPAIEPYAQLGPTHGADIASLWSEVGMFLPSPASPGIAPTPMSPADRFVAAALQDAVFAFARSGSPEHPGLPCWPGYEPHIRPTLLMSASATLAEDPDHERRRSWDGLPLLSTGAGDGLTP